MKKDNRIIWLLKNDLFVCALVVVPLAALIPYISGFSATLLGLSLGALVGVLLFRIIRLEESIKDLRNELQEKTCQRDGSPMS